MCAYARKNLGFTSSLRMEAEETMVNKQGIVSILGSDSDRSSSAASLRRTLSADMSSKKWLSQNGFLSPMKKTASSGEFSISETNPSSSEEEGGGRRGGENEPRSQFDIWASIQEEKNKNKESEKGGQFDMWSSILSQKAREDFTGKPLPPPYVHPLVRRSASSLSEKSLEICTESLGSETGSDGFSSYPPSETGDGEEEKEDSGNAQEEQEPLKQEERGWSQEEPVRVVKSSCLGDKKSPQRSFPPPISSLARQDGASTYMRTRRDNGRLVLEAVAVPSKNYFCAQRQDGRLVLTFAKLNQEEEKDEERWEETKEEEEEMDESEEEFEKSDEESEEKEENEEEQEGVKLEMDFVIENPPKFSSGLMCVHRLALMVNKPMSFATKNPTWPKNFNEIVKLKGQKEDEEMEAEGEDTVVLEKPKPKTPLAQSLPPRPPVTRLIPSSPPPTPSTMAAASTATAASFNVYDYYWRPKPITIGTTNNDEQQYVLLRRNKQRGGGDELVVKGCKDQRRSLWFLEPYCIATS